MKYAYIIDFTNIFSNTNEANVITLEKVDTGIQLLLILIRLHADIIVVQSQYLV